MNQMLAIVLPSCLLGLGFQIGCSQGGTNCDPSTEKVCEEGVIYALDSCGNRGAQIETCEEGCNQELNDCADTEIKCDPPCDLSREYCMDGKCRCNEIFNTCVADPLLCCEGGIEECRNDKCCLPNVNVICKLDGEQGKIFAVDSCGNEDPIPGGTCQCACNDNQTDCKKPCDQCEADFTPCGPNCCNNATEVCCGATCCAAETGCDAGGTACGGCTPQTPCGNRCCGTDDCSNSCAYDCSKDSKVCGGEPDCQCTESLTCDPPCDDTVETCDQGECVCKFPISSCYDKCCAEAEPCCGIDCCPAANRCEYFAAGSYSACACCTENKPLCDVGAPYSDPGLGCYCPSQRLCSDGSCCPEGKECNASNSCVDHCENPCGTDCCEPNEQCIGGTTCKLICYSNSDCGASDICVKTECVPALPPEGRKYRFELIQVKVSEKDPGGNCWDDWPKPCPPDIFITFSANNIEEYRSQTYNDVYEVVFKYEFFESTLTADKSWTITAWDSDIINSTKIESINQIMNASILRQGYFSYQGQYLTYFRVDIRPSVTAE